MNLIALNKLKAIGISAFTNKDDVAMLFNLAQEALERDRRRMIPEQILDYAMDELSSVQLVDNTRQEAKVSRKEMKVIFETVIKMAQR